MTIIGGLDVHRSQITYDWIDTGQGRRGQLALPRGSTCACGWSSCYATR